MVNKLQSGPGSGIATRGADLPFVAIIIPCRNEEKFIGKCLDSILANDYPRGNCQLIVVDGMSSDGTADIIKTYAKENPHIKLFYNGAGIFSTAVNIGLKNADGEFILILDAHSYYQNDYISKCVRYITEYNVDCVGGALHTISSNSTAEAEVIALALAHPFGVGNSYFRIGAEGPRFVDTVPFGCYRKDVFDRIGLFAEDMARNEDDEFNLRLLKSGGKILLVPEIVSYYYARDTLSKLWRMNYQYGYFKPLVALKIGGIMTWRQLAPPFFVLSVLVLPLLSLISRIFLWIFLLDVSLYVVTTLSVSFLISFRTRLKYLPLLPAAFMVIHLSYGTGYLKGLWDFVVLKRHKKQNIGDVPLTR